MKAREWSYWTKNKLEILTDYLPVFTSVSKNAEGVRIYLDLLAGQPANVLRDTGEVFDGSPVVAMNVTPPFSHLRFCEIDPKRSRDLASQLQSRFPGEGRYSVVEGDCNEQIAGILDALMPVRWAPVFAFLDQQAAEIHWETIDLLSRFRRNPKGWKTEQWLLMSPTMIAKGVRGTNASGFQDRVSRLYGTEDWMRVQHARWDQRITAPQYRAEMVNLMRWRFERDLGYRFTHRIPMRMANKTEIYDMLFATDNEVGDRVMRHLYNQAAQREPIMMREAKRARRRRKEEESGEFGLFDDLDDSLAPKVEAKLGEELWKPEPVWDPSENDWWDG